jgi:hypothetical protein
MTEFLVCGVHRSGTSLAANILTKRLGFNKFLDDPNWVVDEPAGIMAALQSSVYLAELENCEVAKIPRAIDHLDRLVNELPIFNQIVVVFRPPFDVYMSVLAAIQVGSVRPWTMLQHHLDFGDGALGFLGYYENCYQKVLDINMPEFHIVNFDTLLKQRNEDEKRYFGPEDNMRQDTSPLGDRSKYIDIVPRIYDLIINSSAHALFEDIRQRYGENPLPLK